MHLRMVFTVSRVKGFKGSEDCLKIESKKIRGLEDKRQKAEDRRQMSEIRR